MATKPLMFLLAHFGTKDAAESYCEDALIDDARDAGIPITKNKLDYFFGSADTIADELKRALYSASFHDQIARRLEEYKSKCNTLAIVYECNPSIHQISKLTRFAFGGTAQYDPAAKSLVNVWGWVESETPRLFVWFGRVPGSVREYFSPYGELNGESFLQDFHMRFFDEDFSELHISRSFRPIAFHLSKAKLKNAISGQLEVAAADLAPNTGNVLFLLSENGFDSSLQIPHSNGKGLWYLGAYDRAE